MTNDTPPTHRIDPPPHALADWVHQKFLARKDRAQSGAGAASSMQWKDSLFHPVLASSLVSVTNPKALVFERREVQSGRIGAAVDQLMSLSDSIDSCIAHRSSLRLTFPGYKDDPREIGQIPEIGRFVQSITRQWPYWLHFLAPDVDNLGVLLTLVGSTGVRLYGDHLQRTSLTPQGVETMQHLVHCTLRLHEYMGLPASISHDMGRALRDGLCMTFV